jgi:hypothetical protein
MRNRTLSAWVVGVTYLALCGVGFAEVLEFEGTVKAVDAAARTIRVERKTAKGMKTLDLEVAKKAGDLPAVKVGDRLTFSYDPDLEIVTKIGARVDDSVAERQNEERTVRITYSYAVDGSTTTTLQLVAADEETGRPADKEEVHPGVWRVSHVFDEADTMSELQGPLLELAGIKFDAKHKGLHVNPKSDEGKKTAMQYPTRLRLPLTIVMDVVAAADRAELQITPNANTQQNLHPFVTITTDDGFRTVDVVDRWIVARDPKSGQPQIKDVAVQRGADTDKPVKVQANAPLTINPEEIHLVRLGAFAGDGAVSGGYFLKSLTVEGRFLPTLGLAVKQDGDAVVAGDVLRNSLAESAGIKPGDRIISIDGKRVDTVQRAVNLLSMTQYGETWNIEAERGGSKKTFSIKAE